ncbi:MAG: hypothetical protein JSV07_09125, partial [Acidimicrobiia bacterium]
MKREIGEDLFFLLKAAYLTSKTRHAIPEKEFTHMARTRSTLNVVSAALALFIMAFLVWDASSAAFTATTSEQVNDVAAASLELSDNGQVELAFDNLVVYPNQSYESCVTITYTGTADQANLSAVAVDAVLDTPANDLTPLLTVDVDEVAACTEAVDSAIEVLQAGAWISNWTPNGNNDSQIYKVTLSMADTSNPAVMGDTAGFTV